MEFDNKLHKHASIKVHLRELGTSIRLQAIKLDGVHEEIAVFVVEESANLLNRWEGGEHRHQMMLARVPGTEMAVWALGVYREGDTMLEWDQFVISKRGEVYKLLQRMQLQKYLHIVVLDQAGRSHELLEFLNCFREAEFQSLNFVQNVELSDLMTVQALMKQVNERSPSEKVFALLRSSVN